MSFLQPAMLIALPLIALPIIIHLINQRRFQTVQWGAMQFLLAANRMSRGYARIRQWLILAARTLALAALVFAISRPLSSGWLAVAGGGQVDTTIVLIDRSPSMTQLGPGGVSKLDAGLAKLVDSLETLGESRYLLLDSVNLEPVEFEKPSDLLQMPEVMPVSSSSDLPALLEATDRYIKENKPSRAEVWMLSDVRRNDWKDDSGRWDAIRESLIEIPQMVRFHLLAYPELDSANRSLTVSQVQRVEDGDSTRLLFSLQINQADSGDNKVTIPVTLEINGATSVFNVELTGNGTNLVDYPVSLDSGINRGWGRVSIPADANPSDNEYYFVFDEQPVRKTLVVSDDPATVRPIEFAASIAPDDSVVCESQTIDPNDLIGQDLEQVSLIVWHVAIPEQDTPSQAVLQAYVQRGGQVIFFPPSSPTGSSFAGVAWSPWQETQVIRVGSWVGDQDLLSRTRSGDALPVGELRVLRNSGLVGDYRALAVLDGGVPLLARASNDTGGVFFCTTTVSPGDSSLASAGVVLYAMIQRAGQVGAMALANTQQVVAGSIGNSQTQPWIQLGGNTEGLSSTYASTAGVYEDQERLFAVNRSIDEDVETIVPEERVAALFANLDFDRVDQTADSETSLIQEVWRLFLICVLLALIAEAMLCIPKRIVADSESGNALAGSLKSASHAQGFADSSSGAKADDVPMGGVA